MSRVWLTCALATVLVVTAVILLTNRPAAEADGQRPPKPPPPLSEQEVRTYLNVMPRITQQLGDIVAQFQRERILNKGKVDDRDFEIRSQALVDAILDGSHLTRDTWQMLSDRVEYAVNVLRAEPQLEAARPELEEKLKLKQALLPTLALESERSMVEKEIQDLEALLDAKGPPLSKQDRDLIRRYWASLDAAVPPRGPPPRK